MLRYYTCIDLQLLCKSRHQTVKVVHVLQLFHWRLAFTTHTIWWLLLSPLGTMCAYSFITHGHGGNQTTNPASVTVTLYLLSHTESFLLAWDYSKIFCSTGPNANTDSSTALLVHEFMKSRTLFPFFTQSFKCGAVFLVRAAPNHSAVKGNAKRDDWSGAGGFQRDIFHFTGPQWEVLICVSVDNFQVCTVKNTGVYLHRDTHKKPVELQNVNTGLVKAGVRSKRWCLCS